MKVVILVGGLGKRLRNVTGDIPKPMVDVNGKPFLEYLIRHLKTAGFKEYILSVGYKSDNIIEYFSDGVLLGVQIEYVIEKELLGTAGAIKLAEKFLTAPFLVINGDTFFEPDYRAFKKFFREKKAVLAIALTKDNKGHRYARIELNPENRVVKYQEKMKNSKSKLISTGNYIFSPRVLKLIPENKNVSLEEELIPELLQAKRNVFGLCFNGYFKDIGTPDGLTDFRNYTIRG